MPARLPVQNKSPFEIDARPLEEMASSHAGLLATSRAFRALKLPDLIAANLPLKERKRGLNEAQILEALVFLQTAGGDCPEDIKILSGDRCLEGAWVFPFPRSRPCAPFWSASTMNPWKPRAPNARSK